MKFQTQLFQVYSIQHSGRANKYCTDLFIQTPGDQIEANDLVSTEAEVEALAPTSNESPSADSRPGTAISTASGTTKLSTMKQLVKDLTERVEKVERSEQSLKLQVTVLPC